MHSTAETSNRPWSASTRTFEWVCPDGVRFGGTYHGLEEVGGFFERVTTDVDDLHLDVDRFVDGGETVVVLGNSRGTARETGERIHIPFAQVLDMEDGHSTRFQEYADTAQMEQALGA